MRVRLTVALLAATLPLGQLVAQTPPTYPAPTYPPPGYPAPTYGQPTIPGQPVMPGQPAPYGQAMPYAQPYVPPAPGVSPLMNYVIGPVMQIAGGGLAGAVGVLFAKLFSALFSHPTPPPNANPVLATTGAPPGYPGQFYGAPAGVPQYGQPQYPQAQPQYAQAQPQYPQAQPQYAPAQPQYPQAQPQYAQAQPQYPQPQPQYAPAQPQFPQPQPQYAPAQPQFPQPQPQYAPAQPQFPQPLSPPAVPGAATSAVASTQSPLPTPGVQSKAVLVPSIIFTLERLDPKTYQTTAAVDLAHGAPELHTGDVFAIEYSTNVSGQVRIDNIDSTGQLSALGTYTVLSAHDNRIPLRKGIQLTGTTGTETFKMYFYPCTATDANGQPDAAGQAAGLVPCTRTPSPKLLDASRGAIVAKSAVNLDSPDPNIAVSAVTNYENSDVAENDFQIQHVAR